MSKKEENWIANYDALKAHLMEHHRLPQKTVLEGRSMLTGGSISKRNVRPASSPMNRYGYWTSWNCIGVGNIQGEEKRKPYQNKPI